MKLTGKSTAQDYLAEHRVTLIDEYEALEQRMELLTQTYETQVHFHNSYAAYINQKRGALYRL